MELSKTINRTGPGVRNILIVVLLMAVHISSFSQRKQVKIGHLSGPVQMDGLLNDKAWENATLIEDFVSFQPVSGTVLCVLL